MSNQPEVFVGQENVIDGELRFEVVTAADCALVATCANLDDAEKLAAILNQQVGAYTKYFGAFAHV